MENIEISNTTSDKVATFLSKTKKNRRKYWRKNKSINASVETMEDSEFASMADAITATSYYNSQLNNGGGDSEYKKEKNKTDFKNELDSQIREENDASNDEGGSDYSLKGYEDQILTSSSDEDVADGYSGSIFKTFQPSGDINNKELETPLYKDYFTSENVLLDGKLKTASPYSCVSNSEFKAASTSILKRNISLPNDQNIAPEPQIYNERFLDKNLETYEVEKFEKNIMIIFNHNIISGYDERLGTEEDVKSLKETFGNFGFEIDIHDDLNYQDMYNTLNEFTQSNFTDYGCVMVVVLTHGRDRGYLLAADIQYHESELINHFFDKNNQTLYTKPKIFIIQACRGPNSNPAHIIGKPDTTIRRDTGMKSHVYTLPTQADVLLFHSTFAGDVSHRSTDNGSWFIQSLCRHVDKLADTMDLESIMREVKMDVAIEHSHLLPNKTTGRDDLNKQIPVSMSTLIRKLYLKRSTNVTKMDGRWLSKKLPKVFASGSSQAEVKPNKAVNTSLKSSATPPVLESVVVLDKKNFVHMRRALRKYSANLQATMNTGQMLLNIANSIDENKTPNSTMECMAEEISRFLKLNSK